MTVMALPGSNPPCLMLAAMAFTWPGWVPSLPGPLRGCISDVRVVIWERGTVRFCGDSSC